MDYFRIVRGLELDEAVRILQGPGVPGSTADTDNAQIGSLYLDTLDGDAYTKSTLGPGLNTWKPVADETRGLYTENPTTPGPSTAQGDNSITLGQLAATAPEATDSLAIGVQSLARLPGSMVFANGRFASSGDVQAGKYLLRTVTVNNNFTEAFLDGTNGSSRLTLPDDSTWTFTITVTAHRTDQSDGHAGYKTEGVVYRAAGAATTAFMGRPNISVLAESNPSLDINIIADTTTGALVVKVKGETGKIYRWAVLVDTLEVTN